MNEFTQLVYDGETREVGVAFSLSRSNKQYVVARYYKKRNTLYLDSEVHPARSGKILCYHVQKTKRSNSGTYNYTAKSDENTIKQCFAALVVQSCPQHCSPLLHLIGG